jgi:hypothetical protein
MIELNPKDYPSEIATLLLLRGAGTPPLEWGKQKIRHAKQVLDTSDDICLFRREGLSSGAMGAAVRSLLYLLNGWTDAAESKALDAPMLEQAYAMSLCARHQADPETAKTFLQRIEEHSIGRSLVQFAMKTLSGSKEPPIKRFTGIVEMGGTWEAFAFVDLYEQARAGKLSPSAYDAVCRIQFHEFTLLFAHCFKAAVGNRPVLQTKEEMEAKKRAAAKRLASKPKPKRHAPVSLSPSAKAKIKNEPVVSSAPVRVRCPRCRNILTVPGTLCGKTAQCIKCQTLFAVPHRKPAPVK